MHVQIMISFDGAASQLESFVSLVTIGILWVFSDIVYIIQIIITVTQMI